MPLLLTQLLWCICECVFATKHRREFTGTEKKPWFPLIHGIVIASFIGFLLFSSFGEKAALTHSILPGFLLVVMGVGLRCWSIRELGDQFRDDFLFDTTKERVSSGPYRYLRHPAEIGLLAILLGCCLVTSDGFLAWFSIALPFSLTRIFLEEKAIRQANRFSPALPERALPVKLPDCPAPPVRGG